MHASQLTHSTPEVAAVPCCTQPGRWGRSQVPQPAGPRSQVPYTRQCLNSVPSCTASTCRRLTSAPLHPPPLLRMFKVTFTVPEGQQGLVAFTDVNTM
jgi:hypothetical protein